MSGSGPTVSMSSIACCAKKTRANPWLPKKEKTNEQQRNPGRLWGADRASHAEDRAPVARSDRAGMGLSHGKRPAATMAGRGPNADAGRCRLRARLAQRRTNQPAGPTAARFRGRAPDAEPDHRV